MELRLLSNFSQNPNLSHSSVASAISLITNSFTSEKTISSIFEALNLHLQYPHCDHQLVLSLLFAVATYHPRFRHHVVAAAQKFILLSSIAVQSNSYAMSLLDLDHTGSPDSLFDESYFLSLCFGNCVKTRRWTLKNVSKFRVRPSVLLTVLLGFTKDPYPDIREGALSGLVVLCNGFVVEDLSLIEGCYFRAVELLFDTENSVRLAAVQVISELGQLLVVLYSDDSKRDWSDALFVQLCLMTRDMDMEIRVAAFTALGKIPTVSVDILLQTLSKKAFAAMKEKNYPGQHTAKLLNIPAYASTFTFPHGLEDEFSEVRRSACHSLQMMTVISSEFAIGAVDRVMDLLNDDSVIVRLQALESLHYMATNDHLKVEESHKHMFFGALTDSSALVRSAARKTLQSTKFQDLPMFRSCVDVLIKNMKLYSKDEAELFLVLFKIGRSHGKFVSCIIQEVSQELEPSLGGKLDFNNARTAALLVLAITAPVSFERQICSIPPQIFSYAVTLLGRISWGLIDVIDKNTLLAYLSHCSRFTVVSASEVLKAEELDMRSKDNDVHLLEKSSEISGALFPKSMELKVTSPFHDFQLNPHVTVTNCTEKLFQKVVDLGPLIELGFQSELVQTLRNWKEELRRFARDSNQPAGIVAFALKYLHVIKLLGKAWACYLSKENFQFNGMVALEDLLGRTESGLNEMLYRFTGLSREDELHILEMILLICTLRLSYREICFEGYMKKMHFVLSRVEYLHKEGSLELSHFIIELQNITREIGNSEDGFIDNLDKLQKSLDLFSLRHFALSGDLKYSKAEIDFRGNDFQNPLPFISGLPVGIPCEITLYNISSESKLWFAMTLSGSTQFVFLDLLESEGCDEIKKSTFIAPYYKTPKAKSFSLNVSIVMECVSEVKHFKRCNGPKNVVHLCKEEKVYLAMPAK